MVGGDVSPLRDPFGADEHRAKSGSAWPAFADEYIERTDRALAMAQSGVGSTAQSAAAADQDGSWNAGSGHVDDAIEMTHVAMEALREAGYRPTFDGICWSQGEADARAIDAGVITPTDYASAFEAMVEYFRDSVGMDVPFYIWQTGMPASGDTPGFHAVRREQCRFPRRIRGVHVVSRIQKTFPARGLMNPEPGVHELHYSQEGYNQMGRHGARAIAIADGL